MVTRKKPIKKNPTKKTSAKPKSAKTSTPAPSGRAKDFEQAMKGMSKKWNTARKVKDDFGGPPELADGTYVAQVASAGVGASKEVPWFRIGFVIIRGDEDVIGKQPSMFQRLLNPQDPDDPRGMENLFKALQRLGYETDNMEMSDLTDIAEHLSNTQENPIIVTIRVKNTVGNDGRKYQNVYVNKLIEDDE